MIEGLYQMASGLKFIHEKKMIYRDIKPENVLISFDGQITCLKIADLGFTKPLNKDGTHFDLTSGLKVTEYYMAPVLLVLRNLNRVCDQSVFSSTPSLLPQAAPAVTLPEGTESKAFHQLCKFLRICMFLV
jgi:serine/threonine protein kinase